MPSLWFRSVRLLGLLALSMVLWSSDQAYAQAEAEGLSASFRKASRRVLPAVVTVRPIGVQNPLDLRRGIRAGQPVRSRAATADPPLASQAGRAS